MYGTWGQCGKCAGNVCARRMSYDGVVACCPRKEPAQPKTRSLLRSVVGAVSAGCLGSTSKLQDSHVSTTGTLPIYVEQTYLRRYISPNSPRFCASCNTIPSHDWISGTLLSAYGTWNRCRSCAIRVIL